MTRLSTILRRTCRPIRDTDRFSLTPAGIAALDAVNAPETAQEGAQTVRQVYDKPTEDGKPKAEWVRGICPDCGGDVVANCYYVGGSGYLTVWECWNSLPAEPTCTYRKIL